MGFQPVAGESVIKEGSVNYQKGWEAVNGALQLTSHRLFFESNRLNVQTGGLGIDLREIASVTPAWTKFLGVLPIVPNSIAVKTTRGQVHSFVVSGRGAWITAINTARRARGSR